ncbi:MAG TPA: cation:proton antiporter [Bryobacteraceae bacterium]|jgi:Kef-type K+ transport system membrane component KefB|nr:cation:proton antiporter [Bryobacteraceae bacterium]
MRIVIILVLAGLMQAAKSFGPLPSVGSTPAGTALACGYLLLTAFFAGSVFKSLGLPRLTGYLFTGIIVGPKVLELVSDPMVANLRIFNGIATALIALTAGVELDLRSMKPLLKTIGWLSVIAVLGTICLLTGAVFLSRSWLPFFANLTLVQTVAISVVLGVTMVAQSPAVVVALHSEMQSDGPLTRTILGIVVMSDLVVIILFAIVSSVAKSMFGSGTDAVQAAGSLAWEVLGSLIIGILVGMVLAVYLRYVKSGSVLFVTAAAFLVAEVGQRVDLDPLLIALAAGVLIRNLTRHGERLHRDIEISSLPVYVVFFAVTGATVHIGELMIVGIPAVILVLTRATGFYTLGWLAATLAKAPDVVRKYAGFGLMPQAGLALALALLFVKTFPHFGAEGSALVLGVVAMNEMVAPVLYRLALVKAGEVGQSKRAPIAAAAH